MAPDHPRYACQTDSGTLEFGAVKALKRRKQPVSVTHVKADAIVLFRKYRLVTIASRTEVNPGAFPGGRIFPGVADQVLDDPSEQARADAPQVIVALFTDAEWDGLLPKAPC